MINYKKMEEVYNNDATFRRIVIELTKLMDLCQMAPSEIRAAAMFAVIRHEMLNPQKNVFVYHPDNDSK